MVIRSTKSSELELVSIEHIVERVHSSRNIKHMVMVLQPLERIIELVNQRSRVGLVVIRIVLTRQLELECID